MSMHISPNRPVLQSGKQVQSAYSNVRSLKNVLVLNWIVVYQWGEQYSVINMNSRFHSNPPTYICCKFVEVTWIILF